MRTKIAMILVFCLFASAAISQVKEQDDPNRTGGMVNGRWWEASSESAKLGYLMGFYDGLNLVAPGDKPCIDIQTRLKDNYKSYFNWGEIRGEIDSFYKEGANVPLPVFGILRYVSSKAKGASTEDLEKYLADYRKRYVGK